MKERQPQQEFRLSVSLIHERLCAKRWSLTNARLFREKCQTFRRRHSAALGYAPNMLRMDRLDGTDWLRTDRLGRMDWSPHFWPAARFIKFWLWVVDPLDEWFHAVNSTAYRECFPQAFSWQKYSETTSLTNPCFLTGYGFRNAFQAFFQRPRIAVFSRVAGLIGLAPFRLVAAILLAAALADNFPCAMASNSSGASESWTAITACIVGIPTDARPARIAATVGPRDHFGFSPLVDPFPFCRFALCVCLPLACAFRRRTSASLRVNWRNSKHKVARCVAVRCLRKTFWANTNCASVMDWSGDAFLTASKETVLGSRPSSRHARHRFFPSKISPR